MSFAAPLLLIALVLLPLAAVAYVRHERRRSGGPAFASAALLPAVTPRRPGWRRHVGPALYLLAAAALLVALARPERTVAVPVQEASVLLVTDHSASMRSTDVAPNRMQAAKQAAGQFLDDVPRDIKVGAIAFNHRVRVLAPPTVDRPRVRRAIDGLQAKGSTAAGDALATALRILRPRGAEKDQIPAAIILLSDGESVRGVDPVPVAEKAGREGVRIFTVALGTDEGTLTTKLKNGKVKTEPVPPDRDTLRQIAEASGGSFSDAPSAAALKAAYEQLGSKVATTPGTKEATVVPVGVAFALLLLGAGLSLRLTGRFV